MTTRHQPATPEEGPELLVSLWRLRSHPAEVHVEYDRPPGCIQTMCSRVIRGDEQVQHSRQPLSRVRNPTAPMCPVCLEQMELNLKHHGVLDPTETTTGEENDQ